MKKLVAKKFTVKPIFLASVDSAIFANGLSAPQHSTYLVILLLGRDLDGTGPDPGKRPFSFSFPSVDF